MAGKKSFELAKILQYSGMSKNQASKMLGVSNATIRNYYRADTWEEHSNSLKKYNDNMAAKKAEEKKAKNEAKQVAEKVEEQGTVSAVYSTGIANVRSVTMQDLFDELQSLSVRVDKLLSEVEGKGEKKDKRWPWSL